METFTPVLVPSDDWTLIADGSAYSEVGLQNDLATDRSIIFVGTAEPAETTQDYLKMGSKGTPAVTLTLGTSDLVYAKGIDKGVLVRGYRVAV